MVSPFESGTASAIALEKVPKTYLWKHGAAEVRFYAAFLRKQMKAANYMKLRQWSLWQCCYVIVDVPEYLADNLFMQEQVRVSFGKEYSRKGSPYVLIFCQIRKKDEDRFLRALGRLEQKMLLMGYTDYNEFCGRLFAELGKIKTGESQPAAGKAES